MPYARLSSYYFFHFAALGALVPFWGPYLLDRGFEPVAIGVLMAILMGTKIVAPNLFGSLADWRGQRMLIVRLGALLALLSFTAVFWADGFWPMALTMAIWSFFWNGPLPLIEAVTFNHLGTRVSRYAQVRVWGSIGFILVVLAVGWWQQQAGSGVVPIAVLLLFGGILLSVMLVPDCPHAHVATEHLSLRRLVGQREVMFFLAACLLMQASHGAYYAFYSIYLEAEGYSDSAVGALWAFGVVIEVLVFLRMHRLLERFSARALILWSLALAVLRWLLIGLFVDIVALQIAAQALHAASFGVFHASAIHLTHRYFPGVTQARGQALYNSISFGVGGALGSLTSGLLWSAVGASWTYSVAAGFAALGFVAAASSKCRGSVPAGC
ncbi:MFS transporter [Lamprobacter modestohalophilus]|uniref:MFS transporter n=1 Tax=Lamprobacter modestohalophilus TaxID=1064514 RepID=UPI002ADEB087|nr:MFS transporter [Lamprobacter modestohalophilus]MEA1048816.1 MFS transporter [Lamprobacter modestohalophilus]